LDTYQLKCFIAAAETLHFGRAAQSMDMLPASLGRQIQLLERRLETKLFIRTTRNVSLTEAGAVILEDARTLVEQAESFERKVRGVRKAHSNALKVGAIDSAAVGLVPQLLKFARDELPELEIQLIEQKTIRLLPKLLSGSLDLAFCRPPDVKDPRLVFRTLFYESAVVALPQGHRLANALQIEVSDLRDEPLIVPDRRSRPHSHDLTIKLLLDAGLTARIAQVAEEKQTIVNLVAAGTGLAIVPRWTSKLQVAGVAFVPLSVPEGSSRSKLILSAAWARGARDPSRDAIMQLVDRHLKDLETTA